jgi:hypothetical protein
LVTPLAIDKLARTANSLGNRGKAAGKLEGERVLDVEVPLSPCGATIRAQGGLR